MAGDGEDGVVPADPDPLDARADQLGKLGRDERTGDGLVHDELRLPLGHTLSPTTPDQATRFVLRFT